MTSLIIFLIIVFLLAAGFAWLADQPGSLLVLKFGGFEFAEENLAVIAAIVFALLLAAIFIWIIVTMVWRTPGNIGSFFKNRRREKGWRALADGMIAVGSGDASMARKAARDTVKFLPEEPVAQIIAAQAAQMNGKQDVARQAFEAMLEEEETKLVGLRGLYMEAEATGQMEAAQHLVEQAVETQPGLEWSGKALLSLQASQGDWQSALVTLQQNADAKLYTKKEAKRLRAVLLTAFAAQLESGDPQKAKEKALEAHRLAPELVPAAVIAGRVASRLGELRKATKVIEACWKLGPHPDLMSLYTHLRSGDSGVDRVKRAETLNGLKANHAEGIMGVARAKIDVQDWKGARAVLETLVKTQPTERACLLMSEIEEGDYGDRGRMREWLSRAVRAPRDATWTADGYIADEWAPLSPISGELDAFEWRVPLENLGEEEDLSLEEIPQGPIDLPVIETTASTGMTLVAVNDDDKEVYVAEKADEPETSSKQEARPSQDMPAKHVADGAVEASDQDDKKTLTESPIGGQASVKPEEEAERLEKKSEEALDGQTTQTSEKTTAPKDSGMQKEDLADGTDDPINQGPIDDPGLKEGATPTRKRFKLF